MKGVECGGSFEDEYLDKNGVGRRDCARVRARRSRGATAPTPGRAPCAVTRAREEPVRMRQNCLRILYIAVLRSVKLTLVK